MYRSVTGCRQKAKVMRRNKIARKVMEIMHREFRQNRCVVMDRAAILEHIVRQGAPTPDDPTLAKKVADKREYFLKGACIRLVKLGQLASRTTKRGGKAVQLYALPDNKEYLSVRNAR